VEFSEEALRELRSIEVIDKLKKRITTLFIERLKQYVIQSVINSFVICVGSIADGC